MNDKDPTPTPPLSGSNLALAALPPALLAIGLPAVPLELDDRLIWIILPLVLVLSGALSTFRMALLRSVPERVLGLVDDEARRERLGPLLERADVLASTAGLLRLGLDLGFAVLMLTATAAGEPLSWGVVASTIALAVPLLVVAGELMPSVWVGTRGDQLLAARLPLFALLLGPLSPLGSAIERTRKFVRRVAGLEDDPATTRRIVEGLREAIVDAELERDLDETEREIIGNVMEFHDVDVAAVMTPRTEICGVEVGSPVREAVKLAADSGHSRIPVFDRSLDAIIGVLSIKDVVRKVEPDQMDQANLSELLRPPYFVPETKRVSELLAEFRRERAKMAIVLDEYGGTAGLVSMGDVIGELVGDLHDEHDDVQPEQLRQIDENTWELDATLHVTEANEELDIELPEEADYETVGGFVLAQLGHFPKRGETVLFDELEIVVTESSDRRVLKLLLRRLAPRS
ncbi:hemolysin family protein [Engelhardtia mirabilis]|uniref:hemolysin family protein n=1 Tax=Engelhardtia mirabilis TaxID=2528011 RepID=UPI003AF37F04